MVRACPPVTSTPPMVAAFTAPEESPPLPLVAVICLVPAAMIVGIIISLVQRLKQIKGGEEDAAADY